ncbi:FKBP-type peptidyl-prolyl cis-trans isomerase [Sunxiuqinia rutila]|uniref:FKBP-type peptidyl-prolyl cis-trans isomerase n=1 Tax=Sunxiuqinia rutila TaxID=1397841 RepID=UPI003D36E6C4
MMKQMKGIKFLLMAVMLVAMYSCFDDPVQDTVNYTPTREAELLEVYLDTLVNRGYDIDTTSSGIFYVIEEQGEGLYIQSGDSIGIKYTGFRSDNGQIFDSSTYHYEDETWKFRYEPGNLIDGFEDALMLMNEGTKGLFIIPSNLAYGASGSGSIPPYTTLSFSIELKKIYQ